MQISSLRPLFSLLLSITGEDAERYLHQDKENNQRSAIKQGNSSFHSVAVVYWIQFIIDCMISGQRSFRGDGNLFGQR